MLFFVGCPGSGRPKTAPVTGTVTFQGQPLEQGTVVFDVEGAPSGKAKIVDGKIVDPTTYKTGDGIPVGKARIAVYSTKSVESAPGPVDPNIPEGLQSGGGMSSVVSLIPAKYTRPDTSGLTYEITSKNNVIDLVLE